MTRLKLETEHWRATVTEPPVAVGTETAWYTVAFQGKDERFYPVTMKGQGFRTMFAKRSMRAAEGWLP
jgi:hypothetical protein